MQTVDINLDGPLFKQQRLLILRLLEWFRADEDTSLDASRDADLLEGLTELLDAIADQAHDNYQVDCLITEDDIQEWDHTCM